MASVVQIGPQTLDLFENITSGNARLYLLNYGVFYQSDYQTIKNFFTGRSKSIDSGAFVNLRTLRSELTNILEKFDQFALQLENIRFVELLSIIEDTKTTLDSLANITKWARVTLDTFGYNPNFKVQYVLGQYDTLEKVAASVMRSSNPQDDWRQIAIDNLLSEDDYTSEGGKILRVPLQNKQEVKNFNITSVIDIIDKDTIKGRDLDRFIHFEGEDLAVLGETETIEQSVRILATLKKRDNLDFLNHGLQSSLLVGQSKNLFNFPVVQRQLQETFATDDTLKDFTLDKFWFEEDRVFISFSVRTRVGEVLELTTQI